MTERDDRQAPEIAATGGQVTTHKTHDNPAARWRPAIGSDLAWITWIAGQVHPSFPEDPRVFAERLALYPPGTRVLGESGESGKSGGIGGYLVAHPWRREAVPALNSLLHAIPPHADVLYLHDLALMPAARGTGAGRIVVEQMVQLARNEGLPAMSLVAVNGSVPFWERLGFHVRPVPALAQKLASYEPDARLMVRELGARD